MEDMHRPMLKITVMQSSARFIRMLALSALLTLSCAIEPGHAQSIPTPDSEEQRRRSQEQANERERLRQAPNVDLQQEPAPDGSAPNPLPDSTPCFFIHHIGLETPSRLPEAIRASGASELPQDPLHFAQEHARRYQGKCLGTAGIEELARRLQRDILRRGYSTTRVLVPPQDLSSGTLTFTLLPGVIREIRFAGSANGNWRSAFPTRPGELLNLRKLEQGMEQMKRLTSREAEMEILPGAAAGESDIVIHLRQTSPWRLVGTFDNSGASATGRLQAGLTLALDDPLGLNDAFSASLSTDAERRGAERGTGGSSMQYALPWGWWNFSLAAGSYRYHQRVAGFNQSFLSSGRSRNLDITVQRLFQRDQWQKNSLQLRLNRRWSRAFIDDTEIQVQRRHTGYAELGWVHQGWLGEAQLNLTLANRWGVSWFGSQADAPDREPDGPTFRYSLQTLDATLAQPFSIGGAALRYSGTLRAQTSRSRLYLADQISIGNRYTVRGFDGDITLASERGVFLRNDIEKPFGQGRQSLYLGLDYGRVAGPSAAGLPVASLAGLALGLRGGAAGLSWDISAAWALHKPDAFAGKPVLGFTLLYQY
jgi:hemolysin activation/secretion protein